MNTLDKALFDFYLVKQGKVLVFPNDATPTNDVVDRFNLFILSLTYKIENHKELLSYPLLLGYIHSAITAARQTSSKLEKSIMDKQFFENSNIRTISELIDYLAKCSDVQLQIRLKEAAAQYDECLICMGQLSDSFTECGHSMCKNCFGRLEKKVCPFCVRSISVVYSKEEFAKVQSQKEEAKRLELEKKGLKEDPTPVKKLKRLTIVRDIDDFLAKRVKALFSAGTGKLTQQAQEEICALIRSRQSLILGVVTKDLSSEELSCFTIAKLALVIAPPAPSKTSIKDNGDETNFFNSVVISKINTPNRLLRFLGVLGGNEPTPDEKIMIKFRKVYRRVIMTIIDKFEHTPQNVEQIKKHLPIWKILTKSIHAGEFKKFDNAQKLISGIREKAPFPCRPNSSVVEELFLNKDLALFDFFAKNPGLFFRSVIRICCTFPDNGKEIEDLAKLICPRLKPEQMFELDHVLQRNKDSVSCYVTKKGTFKFIDSKKDNYAPKNQKIVSDVLRDAMKIKKIQNVEYCILDKRLTRNLIAKGPVQDPILNLPKIPSSRGSTVDLTEILKIPDVEIVFFQYWKNGKERIDLDLSFLGLDKDKKKQKGFYCDFTNLRGFNGTAQHSGDITDAPNGASEFIRFKWSDMMNKNPNLAYMIMICFSFNGVPFEEMGEAYCGIGYKTDTIKGDGPFGCHVIDGCRLKGSSQVNLPAVIDVVKKEVTFMSVNVEGKGRRHISIGTASRQIADIVCHFLEWKKTPSAPVNWYELGLNILTFYDKILIIDDGFKYYCRHEKESVIEFSDRVKEGSKMDQMENELLLTLKDGKETKDAKPWIYFGPTSKFKFPKNSIVVSHDDPDINYLDDPFKILHFK